MSSELFCRSSLRSLGSGSFDANGSITSLDWPERCEERDVSWYPGSAVHLDGVSTEADLPLQLTSDQKVLTGVANDEEGSLPRLSPAVSMSSSSSIGSSLCSSGCDPVTSETDEFSSNNSCCDSGLEDSATQEEVCVVSRTKPDIYGQQHPIETAALIAVKLQEFDLQIQQQVSMYTSTESLLSPPKFITAERLCPHIVTSSFKLLFLRCECFEIDNAIKRYIKYWDKRVEIFGEERAFQPITIDSFYERNEQSPLELGALQIIYRHNSSRDPTSVPSIKDDERNMLWVDAVKLDPTKYSREAGIRAFWYFFHALLEDEQVQQRGLICLCYSAHFSHKNRDPTFSRMCLASLQGCLPIRLSAFHGCHPPTLFRIAARLFLLFVGERIRKRVIPHAGTIEHVVSILENKYHISRDHIPAEMGGNLEMDVMTWIHERKAAGL
jgi:CRAL/TRIO domain